MISLNNTQQLVFITEASVYCAVRSGSLNKMDYVSFLKDLQINKYYTLMFTYQSCIGILVLNCMTRRLGREHD